MPDTEEPVFFLLPDGTEISDDPRWKAKKFKEQLERQSANLAAQADFAAKAQAERFKKSALGSAGEATEDEEDEDERNPQSNEFSGLTVAQLKQEAAERDIDLKASGVSKKSEVIELLLAHDASQK